MNDQPQAMAAERNVGSANARAKREPHDCGEFGIRIARDGTWYYEGSPIARQSLVRLFSTVLKRDSQGDYWLETPVEKGRVEVEDAPFTAVELAVSGIGRHQVLRLRTNVDEWIEAGPDHPLRVVEDPKTCEPRPYLVVRDRLEALMTRAVYYELVALGVEASTGAKAALGVWSKDVFFPLSPLHGSK